MANEFSDFKVRHYDTTSGKLRILKEIFTRLDLSPLQKRYDDLSQKIISQSFETAEVYLIEAMAILMESN